MDGCEVTVDLETCSIVLRGAHDDDRVFRFDIDGFARHCLLNGMDRLDYLLANRPAIERHEDRI